MRSLDGVIFWMAIAIFLVVGGLVMDAAVRPLRRSQAGGEPFPGNRGLELAWAVAPAVLLAVVGFLSYQAL